MTRSLVSETAHVPIQKLVGVVRGGRGGPRSKRATRLPSDGSWNATGLTWRMTIGETVVWSLGASIEARGHVGTLRLFYSLGMSAFERAVDLHTEPMHIGGVRWWATCPECTKRRGVIFVRGPRVGCRVCFGLVYRSSRQKPGPRARGRMFALARRLDEASDLEWGLPPKPSRVRWSTYERIARRFASAAEEDAAYFARMARRFGFD